MEIGISTPGGGLNQPSPLNMDRKLTETIICFTVEWTVSYESVRCPMTSSSGQINWNSFFIGRPCHIIFC